MTITTIKTPAPAGAPAGQEAKKTSEAGRHSPANVGIGRSLGSFAVAGGSPR